MAYSWGVKIDFTSVCMFKMLRILCGIQICMQTRKPLTFAPPLPNPQKSGCWDRTAIG